MADLDKIISAMNVAGKGHENFDEGFVHYGECDAESRAWFRKQWEIHPERAHPERTTNFLFHSGGICAAFESDEELPEISESLAQFMEVIGRPHLPEGKRL